jgi:molybdopterin molybdotransferase
VNALTRPVCRTQARPARGTVRGVIPLPEAQSFVLERCPARAPVELPFEQAAGMVLAVDVIATELVPPFDNTAVDGYAVIAADVANAGAEPVKLRIVGEVAAGAATDWVLARGETIRIMTGAPIPRGADAVVMVEDSELIDEHTVQLSASVQPGDAVRPAGDDVNPGEVVLAAGTLITPPVLGVLAMVNALTVSVYPRVRAAVLSTGDELVDDGRPLAPGEIRESNRRMLAVALREAGCDVTDLGTVRDDEAELERVLRSAADSYDVVVSSGGVSMGDYDVVKAVLGRIAIMEWMQVAIKPAKPFAFGLLEGTPVFGLPGNPVSSFVSFEMFARPALRQMMGFDRLARPSMVGIADVALERRPDGKTHLMRVQYTFGDDGRCHVVPVRAQGSHQLAATSSANAIAVVPDGDGIPAGGEVAVLLLLS